MACAKCRERERGSQKARGGESERERERVSGRTKSVRCIGKVLQAIQEASEPEVFPHKKFNKTSLPLLPRLLPLGLKHQRL